jgi:ribosomal protein L10
MLIKQIVIRKKAQEIEKKSPYILLFHCSGLTSRQWRQLKNLLCAFRGRTLFRPNYKRKLPHKNKQGGFIEQLASSAGPTCILYLTKEAPDNTWSQLLPLASYNQNLVLLYGQLQSTLVNHMDIKKAANLEITSVFQQLFELIFYPYNSLCFCLNKPIYALPTIQEKTQGGLLSHQKITNHLITNTNS